MQYDHLIGCPFALFNRHSPYNGAIVGAPIFGPSVGLAICLTINCKHWAPIECAATYARHPIAYRYALKIAIPKSPLAYRRDFRAVNLARDYDFFKRFAVFRKVRNSAPSYVKTNDQSVFSSVLLAKPPSANLDKISHLKTNQT